MIYYPQCRAILQVVLDGYGEEDADSAPLVIPVLPKGATIHRNRYDEPDSWELSFDADDLPVDPQLVRAGAAEIYLFQTRGVGDPRLMDREFSDLDAANAAVGEPDPLGFLVADAGLASAKGRFTWGQRPMIAGLFDDMTINLDEGGRWLSISGQDYTAYLDARQWPPEDNGSPRRIPVGKRLDLWAKDILAIADPEERLAVVVENVDAADLPIVGSGETRGRARGIPIEADTTCWTVISKIVRRHGMICYVRGLDLVITHPRNLTDNSAHRVKYLAWGRNLESLELTRKLSKKSTPAVVIRAYHDGLREPIEVEYPPGTWSKVKESARKLKSGQTSTKIVKTNEYEIVPVYGVRDAGILLQMAKARYDRLGREEREAVFRTRDLKDLEDRDLLDLGPGDAVRIGWEEFARDHAVLSDDRIPTATKISHLVARGFLPGVAQVIAERYTELRGLQRPLRLGDVTYEYDAENGVSIEGRLLDFIVVDGVRDPNQRDTSRPTVRLEDGTAAAPDEAALVTQWGDNEVGLE